MTPINGNDVITKPDDKIQNYRIDKIESEVAKISKALAGNGSTGVIESIGILNERMESRKDIHDKDVKRIETLLNRMLWWIVSMTATTLLALLTALATALILKV